MLFRNTLKTLGIALALALPALPATTAFAQKAPDAAALKADLASGDEARVLKALAAIEKQGAKAKPLVPQLEALLKRGSSVPVLTKCIDVTGNLEQASSSKVLAPYYRHRVPEVRRGAVKALLKTRGPDAVAALRRALRSPDAQVRGVAASGLGSLNAREALPDLFSALDHRVGEAAGSIGQLCQPKECEKFASYLGKMPLDIMTSGFDQILFRDAKEMPDDQKIRIVGRVRELGTKDAGNYLADVAERWPDNWSKRVKQSIDSAVKALGGKAGGS